MLPKQSRGREHNLQLRLRFIMHWGFSIGLCVAGSLDLPPSQLDQLVTLGRELTLFPPFTNHYPTLFEAAWVWFCFACCTPVGQDVVVTNTELEGERVVSTSFHVSMDGMVNKTQRLLVRIKDSKMAKIMVWSRIWKIWKLLSSKAFQSSVFTSCHRFEYILHLPYSRKTLMERSFLTTSRLLKNSYDLTML